MAPKWDLDITFKMSNMSILVKVQEYVSKKLAEEIKSEHMHHYSPHNQIVVNIYGETCDNTEGITKMIKKLC